jgi:hypothetical protein
VRWTAIGIGWVRSFSVPFGTSHEDAWKEAMRRFGADVMDIKLSE